MAYRGKLEFMIVSYLVLLLLIMTMGGCSDSDAGMTRRQTTRSGQNATPGDTKPVAGSDAKDVDTTPSNDATTAEQSKDLPETKPARTSGGSGGANGLVEVNYTDTRGLASSYKINAPADAGPGKAYGLHVHFHGDGGGGYRDFPNRETRYGLIGVTVKAPNTNLQWGRAQGVAHAQYADDLLQNEIVKKYNVDLDRIYFSGVSGGAYFLGGNFIPAVGAKYASGAMLMCGGEAPRVAAANPAFLKDFRIHWQVTQGERADITQSVNQSIQAYKDLLQQEIAKDPGTGVDPALIQTNQFEGAGGHCEFDGLAYTPGIQSMMDRQFKIILPATEQTYGSR